MRQFRMPCLPLFQAPLLAGRLAVFFRPGQQLQQQPVARLLEGVGRAFESLEELGADQPANLLLAVLDPRIDRLVPPDVIGQGVVDAQGEERLVLLERLLDHPQQPPVRPLDRVAGNNRRLACGEHRHAGALLDLAFLDIGPAPLDNQRLEHAVAGKHPLGFGQVGLSGGPRGRRRLEQFALHVDKVPAERVDSQRAGEIVVVRGTICVPPHEQLGHVAEIMQRVVDRRRRQEEELLLASRAFHKVQQVPVTRRAAAVLAGAAGIAEMVGLVDHDHVGQFLDPLEAVGELAAAAQIGMAEDDQAAEIARARPADVRQVVAQHPFPDIHASRFGDEQRHALPLVHHEPLDHHQPDERLAKAHAIAQERAAELPGDLHQGVVSLLLVVIQDAVHPRAAVLRASGLPLVGGQPVAAAELVERPDIDLERRVLASVALDDLENFRADVLGIVPMFLVPLLEDVHRGAGDLDVQLNVFRNARQRQIRRADQGERADHFLPSVGDVGLGMKLVALVDAALDLARADRLDNRRNSREKVVFLLLSFEAVVKPGLDSLDSLGKGLPGAARDFVAHQDADRIDLLPLVAQAQEPADLEEARRDVDRLRKPAPVVQVTLHLPVIVAVVDDEQFAAGLACPPRHALRPFPWHDVPSLMSIP